MDSWPFPDDEQELVVTYWLDARGEPVEDEEFLRLTQALRQGWKLTGIDTSPHGRRVAHAIKRGRDPSQ
ncbi:hypothetical protein [Zavarzinella formosa]|uniref:hypothetical protein n=1 Tax=Zavarzinella formosa TaxID=360055 RepID=UPI0003067D58|nr:hypothetical protein [Zavarzinella formosa]